MAPTMTPTPNGFFNHLQTLPHLQLSFLEHLDLNQAIASLQTFLESGDMLQLYLVSNTGSAREDLLGSFKWELAIGWTVLWTCKGLHLV
jgi:hypothetical protein